ncbi:LON peptidase substrate-binding domain-containing protein [Microbacterium sp. C7(2022)]|uniref:LON peptidase substrate-binding domain-containing protein n=1 Tax=Microbacterium sp. C7(2022) TaxID=2992759 RepID=UPI00237A5B7F|nr:LON peptidase substrate-binding domain-containing protein [Microbacterium sp. C7(2022)]MDE0547446.1 LON peptidase substrate-binding domain-containing protein [Microbacterium sp. C7(2022)]
MSSVAMFPLGSVLLPHTPLALRLFEPRYLTMLGRLLDEENPLFGVVMIERGSEVGGGDQRSRIGTLARIVQVEAAADAMHVVAVGGDRFETTRWLDDDPYPLAEISPLPVLEWDDALLPLHTEAEAIVRRVVARATLLSERMDEALPDSAPWNALRWDAATELSEDPIESAWQLAAIAPLGDFDRQTLLRSTTVGGLLRQVIDLTLEQEAVLTASDSL